MSPRPALLREVVTLEREGEALLKMPIEQAEARRREWMSKFEALWNQDDLPEDIDRRLTTIETRVSQRFSIPA